MKNAGHPKAKKSRDLGYGVGIPEKSHPKATSGLYANQKFVIWPPTEDAHIFGLGSQFTVNDCIWIQMDRFSISAG